MMRCLALLWLGACYAASPAKIVLVAGNPSHGPGAHEFNAGTMLLEKMLRQNKGVEPVVVKGGWPADESVFDGARSLVFYMDGGGRHPLIQPGRLDSLGKRMAQGVGLAGIHYTVEVPEENGGKEFVEWFGGYYERPYSRNPINDIAVTQATPAHEVSRGWSSFQGRDEWYYRIRFLGGDRRVTPILTLKLPKDKPVVEAIAWATERADGGRAFGFTGGHFHDNWGIPEFRRMVVNAILWTAKVKVPRGGARCEITKEDLTRNLDPKPAPKKK